MADLSSGVWLNDPADCMFENGTLHVTTGGNSDFWRHTHYGFVRDNGHFLQIPAPAHFTATLTFEGDYETLYDQAGLMLRVDNRNWIKC